MKCNKCKTINNIVVYYIDGVKIYMCEKCFKEVFGKTEEMPVVYNEWRFPE